MIFAVKFAAYSSEDLAAQSAGTFDWETPRELKIEYADASTSERAVSNVINRIVSAANAEGIRMMNARKSADEALQGQKIFFRVPEMHAEIVPEGINILGGTFGMPDILAAFRNFTASAAE